MNKIAAKFKTGDPVTHIPTGEKGIVKSRKTVGDAGWFVVFRCDGNWEKFMDYTGEIVRQPDLKMGWPDMKCVFCGDPIPKNWSRPTCPSCRDEKS